MKKLCAMFLSTALFCGCAATMKQPGIVQFDTTEIPEIKEKRKDPVFGITVPPGWEYAVEQVKVNNELQRIFAAKSNENIGDTPAEVTIVATALDTIPEELFGESVVLVMKNSGTKIILKKNINIDGKVGTFVLYESDKHLYSQIQVGIGHVGFIITCRGDVKEFEAVGGACRKVLSTASIQ